MGRKVGLPLPDRLRKILRWPHSGSPRQGIRVRPSQKETLEAHLGNRVKFAVTVSLPLRLSGDEPDAGRDSFNSG